MLYYIHGYESNPNGTKGILFKQKLGAIPIKYRDCKPEEIVILDCLDKIFDVIKNDEETIIIGSSLGGFLAAKIALLNKNVKKLILLNPAILPPWIDIKKIEGMPIRILQDVFDKRLLDEKISAPINIFVGTDDEVVPTEWVLEFAKAQEATVKFLHDDHRFTKNMQELPIFISDILN
jgi:predicted esterase YcpF (UPF0227 family)